MITKNMFYRMYLGSDCVDLPKRKPNRLKAYDYSRNGAYFITICSFNREYLLSHISVGDGSPVPQLTTWGKVVNQYISLIPEKYAHVRIVQSVIMPNHLHMVILLNGTEDLNPMGKNGTEDFLSFDKNGTGNPSPTIGNVIGWFKYQTTKQVNLAMGTVGNHLWQRSYHDHIIRNEQDYCRIWQYINENPANWSQDCFFDS